MPVLVPGSSDGSALLAGPGPGLVLVSKALHCAARPGPGCHHDHASTLLILLKEWMLYMYIALISTRSSSFYSEHVLNMSIIKVKQIIYKRQMTEVVICQYNMKIQT